jgi:hypothetical protein
MHFEVRSAADGRRVRVRIALVSLSEAEPSGYIELVADRSDEPVARPRDGLRRSRLPRRCPARA